jgi:hypothetical protein
MAIEEKDMMLFGCSQQRNDAPTWLRVGAACKINYLTLTDSQELSEPS